MTNVEATPTSPRAPWAKKRILETATELFYAHGIRLVGVDRLIGTSQVTKATFYKHYRSKDNLVIAYMAGAHARDKEDIEAMINESAGPRDAIGAIVTRITDRILGPGFRGDLYLNAAAEHPDPSHPVRILVSEHRDWYSTAIETIVTQMGHPSPGEGTADFIVARDGAMCGGYVGDPVVAVGALRRAVERIVAAATPSR